MLPTGIVAAVAALLQVVLLLAGSRAGTLEQSSRVHSPPVLDYAAQPFLAIPRLAATFVAEALRVGAPETSSARFGRKGGRVLAASAPTSAPREDPTPPPPNPAPTPTPSRAPVVPGTGRIIVSMTVDRRTAEPGDIVTYTVFARNTGDAAVTTAFVTNTHAPRFTLACTESGQVLCAVPGDYDGNSTNPSDPHLIPVQTNRTVTIPANATVVVRTVRVQVQSALPGTVLHNHAHVDVVGDSLPVGTYIAPKVVVQ